MSETEKIFKNWDYGKTWFHGSPERVESLRPGSSITQNRRLAEAFSHKPSLMSIGDDGAIRHDGSHRGWLYVVDEAITAKDVRPYPLTGKSLAPGDEWLTCRDLRLRFVGPVAISLEERLTPQEGKEFLQKIGKTEEELRVERADLDQLRRLDGSQETS